MHTKTKRFLQTLAKVFLLSQLTLFLLPLYVQAQDNCYQCHATTDLENSVHSILDCTDCHKNIRDFPHPEEAVLNKKESVSTCTSCHEKRIVESYQQSFHGKALYLGSTKTASCADCHGSHAILGPDNPDSQVAKHNIPETCATCHGQVASGFAKGEEHFTLTASGPGSAMYYTAKFFTWLTVLTMTALIIHIELQLFLNIRTILKERANSDESRK